MSSAERQRLYDDVSQALRLMSAMTVLHSQAVAGRAGIHSTDMETLDILNVLGAMTAGRLGEMTGLTSGAVTRLVDRLERHGLAHRQADPSDRRRVIIVPDREEGQRRLFPYFEPLLATMEALFGKFSDDELRLVARFLEEANALVRDNTARLELHGDAPETC
ncbi:MAG: MarR family transcriptional regulator [Dehalococcoidia bacterium]